MNDSQEASLNDVNNDIYRCQAYIYRHLDSSRHHLNENWPEYKKITDVISKVIGDVTENITQYRYRGNTLSTNMFYEHDIYKLPDDDAIIRYSGSVGRLLIHVYWSMVEVGRSVKVVIDIAGGTVKTTEHNKHHDEVIEHESCIRDQQYKNVLMNSLKVAVDALIALLKTLYKRDDLNNLHLNDIKPKETKESSTTIDDKIYSDFVYNNSPETVSKILRSHVIIEDILSNSTLDDMIIVNHSMPGIMLYEFYQHDQKKDNGRCFGVGVDVNGVVVFITNDFIGERMIPTTDNDDFIATIHKRWAEQLMRRYDELSSVKQ